MSSPLSEKLLAFQLQLEQLEQQNLQPELGLQLVALELQLVALELQLVAQLEFEQMQNQFL